MSPLPDNTDPDSVAWITQNAAAAVEDQQRRSESLQTRAGQIAGFAGATVALGVPIGRTALKTLSGGPENAAAVFFFGGSAGLALTIVLTIYFVLRPVKHLAIGASEIEKYVTDPRFVTQTPQEIQFRTLKSLKKTVVRYEQINARKAAWLKWASYAFLYGLLSMIALAVTLGLHYAWD